MTPSVKLGLLPSYRFRWSDWTERMRQDCLRTLSALPAVEVVVPPVGEQGSAPDPLSGRTAFGAVHTLDEAEAVAEFLAREKVDALVVCPVDFGDERSASKVAERLRVPLLLLATKEPAAPKDAALSRVSDSYCGTLSIAAGFHRRKLPFHFAGVHFPDEPGFRSQAELFARAVAVGKGLQGARLGQVGVRPSSFETVAYDEIAMARKFGQNVLHTDLLEVVEQARQMEDDDTRVMERVARIRGSVATVTVSDQHLLRAAKLEEALLDFVKSNRLSALCMQCWSAIQRSFGISVCALFGRITERGIMVACEADMMGALSMLASYGAALGQTVPHFVDWTVQHREDPNQLLAWHCGNAPSCLARKSTETALRSRRDMIGANPPSDDDVQAGLYQFQLKPGPVTFCRLAEYDGEWRMLIAGGEVEPSKETLAGTWSWVRVPDHARLYRTLVEEGFIHHASMIHGDQTEALKIACKLLDIKAVNA
ncbi:MAG TPA: hypothetical protein VGN26_24255 [Armatimonadota bacterium]|jgi:L-fucose isomerase-like protein